jgi:hypothetical protein
MLALARKHDIKLMINYQMAWWPENYSGHDLAESGKLARSGESGRSLDTVGRRLATQQMFVASNSGRGSMTRIEAEAHYSTSAVMAASGGVGTWACQQAFSR